MKANRTKKTIASIKWGEFTAVSGGTSAVIPKPTYRYGSEVKPKQFKQTKPKAGHSMPRQNGAHNRR